ncbi:MAG: PIN domain-containing protein [Oscillospiraceae bacterium]|nr:PIN domain-containing protein [Oscillospiraceae bacterium]
MSVFLVDFENVTSAGLAGIDKLSEDDTVYIFYTPNAASLSFDAHKNIMTSAAKINYVSVTAGAKNALDFQLSSFLGYLAAESVDRKIYIVSADNGYLAVKAFWEKTMSISDIEVRLIPNIRYISRQTVIDPAMMPAKESVLPKASEPVTTIEENGSPESTVSEGSPSPLSADNADENISAQGTSVPGHKADKKNNDTVLSPEVIRIMGIFTSEGIGNDARKTIIDLARSSPDKQHFYTGMTKKFGMEEGLRIYKVLRPEYSNIRKLSKKAAANIHN